MEAARRFTSTVAIVEELAIMVSKKPEVATTLISIAKTVTPVEFGTVNIKMHGRKSVWIDSNREGEIVMSVAETVVARVRTLLAEKRYSETDAIVLAETKRVLEAIPRVHEGFGDSQDLPTRLAAYEDSAKVLVSLVACGVCWGGDSLDGTWAKCLKQLVNLPGDDGLYCYSYYPGLMVLYATGIGAVLKSRYDLLYTVLTEVPTTVFDLADNTLRRPRLVGARLSRFSVNVDSKHVLELLRPVFFRYAGSEINYEAVFDRFEFLHALTVADFEEKAGGSVYGYHTLHAQKANAWEFRRRMSEEVSSEGPDWPPLKAGFFEGDLERLKRLLAQYWKQQRIPL